MIDKDKLDLLAPCIATCPQGNDIRAVMAIISEADRLERPRGEAFEEAWRVLTRTNPLPAVCGRVCPHPCETACNLCDRGCGIAINDIERFLGDWAISHEFKHTRIQAQTHPEKIAVIGSGPAGLACAYHLARRGYNVTIFEAQQKSGGMMRYGIPEYRLPTDIIEAEIENILDLGIELRTGVEVGGDLSFVELQSEYDVVFIGVGAQKGIKLYCRGEDAPNVTGGVEFLRRTTDDKSFHPGDRVVVVGGGDTAVDAARVALRLGSEVTIMYRRTRNEMPAIKEEIREAEAEGVKIEFLSAPKEIETRDERAVAIIGQRMQLGEPDDSGRRRPVPIIGEEFRIDADLVIVAVSQTADWNGPTEVTNRRGWIEADDWGDTGFKMTYAGGDVKGLGLVADAVHQGTKAAEAIHARLRGEDLPVEIKPTLVTTEQISLAKTEPAPRHEGGKLSVKERRERLWAEIKSTITVDEAVAEADRCVKCGTTFLSKRTTPLLLLRRFTQFGIGVVLFNSYFSVFSTKTIYAGPLRNICVPGLNCHACPTATMGCPIGMMQYFAATHRFPWFLIGFLGIIGLISGRFTCGWLCPFGFVQDMVHSFKKLNIRIPRPLYYFKYVVLVTLVFIIPYLTYEHWFSKLCPCGALIAAIPWAIWNPVQPQFDTTAVPLDAIGSMYWIKIWILGVFLMLFLFIKRPFCRTICPLGAIYALFNRISLVSLRVKESCTNCGRCRELCPMDLDFRTEINSENCIKCFDCTQCEHVEFSWNLPWGSVAEASRLRAPPVEGEAIGGPVTTSRGNR